MRFNQPLKADHRWRFNGHFKLFAAPSSIGGTSGSGCGARSHFTHLLSPLNLTGVEMHSTQVLIYCLHHHLQS